MNRASGWRNQLLVLEEKFFQKAISENASVEAFSSFGITWHHVCAGHSKFSISNDSRPTPYMHKHHSLNENHDVERRTAEMFHKLSDAFPSMQ